MCVMISIKQSALCDMGVQLCGSQISVAEQLLDTAQIGTTVQQVGREAMPQGMGTRRIDQAGSEQVRFEQTADAPRRQTGTALIEEEGRLPGKSGFPKPNPASQPTRRLLTDRTEPFAAALAADPDQLLVAVDVVHVQTNQLANPQTAPVEGLQHRAIADTQGRIDGDRLEKANHLIDAEQSR